MAYKKIMQLNGNLGYYFPLFNKHGFRSSISPFMAGDAKRDQHRFALEPISELGLYVHGLGRNVIFNINNELYFLNGSTEKQQHDEMTLEIDLLYQKVTRKSQIYTIETTSYVAIDAPVELHQVVYKNHSNVNQALIVTTAIPLYARSADNMRDHRHVTSLLNRIMVEEGRVTVKPTMQFDERGHQINHTSYHVIASSDVKINGYIPTIDQFINGGSLAFPKGLNNIIQNPYHIDGYEAMGGIQFEKVELKPNESFTCYYGISITEASESIESIQKKYLNKVGFEEGLNQVNQSFKEYSNKLQFQLGDQPLSDRMNWMVIQPMLRRYYGNSFLPHHDYGKGGKGWRDLWQDLLSLIMMGDDHVKETLVSNFKGVRLDGSNATIIGEKPGEFLADRNKIVRVWSDHGAWPLLTVKQYLDETGDLAFLLEKVTYFHDQYTHYTHQTRRDIPKITYQGTILEHLLLQNLVGFLHQGEHGYTKLEDADWNDGLDMAKALGETIAFTHFYTNNLRILADLIASLHQEEIVLYQALGLLLKGDIDLNQYFNQAASFEDTLIHMKRDDVIDKLKNLANSMKEKLEKAFEDQRFQSYYNEQGILLDTKDTANLTGQAMALLSHTATDEQALLLAKRIKKLLFNEQIGGYHLNSRYPDAHMGRAYGFAYHHKENGAIFSHMSVMYAYGLYQYNLVSYGHDAAFTLLKQAEKEHSGVLVGIPEYFNDLGIGKYSYLTGSASWFLKLLREQVFGLSFDLGVLTLKPKLKACDFIDYKANIQTVLFNHTVKITYHNPKALDFGQYEIAKIVVDGMTTDNHFRNIGKHVEVYLDEILRSI